MGGRTVMARSAGDRQGAPMDTTRSITYMSDSDRQAESAREALAVAPTEAGIVLPSLETDSSACFDGGVLIKPGRPTPTVVQPLAHVIQQGPNVCDDQSSPREGYSRGDLVYDADCRRLGEWHGTTGRHDFVRPLGGGIRWRAARADLSPATEDQQRHAQDRRKELSARTAAANKLSRTGSGGAEA